MSQKWSSCGLHSNKLTLTSRRTLLLAPVNALVGFLGVFFWKTNCTTSLIPGDLCPVTERFDWSNWDSSQSDEAHVMDCYRLFMSWRFLPFAIDRIKWR